MQPGRLLYLFLIPGGLILPGVWALLRHSPRPLWLESFLPSYPWAVLGLGVLLGWRFNRTRLIFTLLLFLLAERALHLGVGGGGASLPPLPCSSPSTCSGSAWPRSGASSPPSA